jgi:ShK domain-like
MIWALVLALLALRAGGAVEDHGTATGGNTPSGTCDASTSGAQCEHDDMTADETNDALDHDQQGRSYKIQQTTLDSQKYQNDFDYPVNHEASNIITTESINPFGTNPNKECLDQNESCGYWAWTGECEKNSNYMRRNCQLSCQLCTPHSGEDLGVAQIMSDPDGARRMDEVQRLIHTARGYMHNRFLRTSPSVPSSEPEVCKNRHAKCALWALDGWCETQPVRMSQDCGPICGRCPAPTTIEGRCPMDPNAPNAWAPGDLNRLFTKLSTTEPYLSLYNPQILSSPDTTGGPWVLTMENFITPNEAGRFIELGHEMGFQKSAGTLGVVVQYSIPPAVFHFIVSTEPSNLFFVGDACSVLLFCGKICTAFSTFFLLPQGLGASMQMAVSSEWSIQEGRVSMPGVRRPVPRMS